MYHCLDFHGSLAPLYIEASGLPPIPVALTLHNALYQVRSPFLPSPCHLPPLTTFADLRLPHALHQGALMETLDRQVRSPY